MHFFCTAWAHTLFLEQGREQGNAPARAKTITVAKSRRCV